MGTDDILACFVAGQALNWDGRYLDEIELRHDDVNSCVDALLNFGGFVYIGTVIPWAHFHDPGGSGITYGRLFGLGFLILIFRRIPALMLVYKFVPSVIADWKEALFMGYFGPIGCGSLFYVEYTWLLFPRFGDGDEEQNNLVRAIRPVVCWLVLFSIIVHGLSIPALALAYKLAGVKTLETDAVEIRPKSVRPVALTDPAARSSDKLIAYNRFCRPSPLSDSLPVAIVNRARCGTLETIDSDIRDVWTWKSALGRNARRCSSKQK